MHDKTACHLIVDPPADGAWNMAVDQALLEHAAVAKQPTLRIYRWKRPTLSLGYFQSHGERDTHPASRSLEVVRRQSGGGAILHDQEITYSLVVPADHPLAADAHSLYNTLHCSLIKWLEEFIPSDSGFRVELFESRASGRQIPAEPFLCFQRRSTGDVVLRKDSAQRDHKIIGSAQRRRRGAVLQHGSLLWQTSHFAQELGGFANLSDCRLSVSEALEDFVEALPHLFSELAFVKGLYPAGLIESAQNLQGKRYQQSAWTERR